jgi:hypothetical protein
VTDARRRHDMSQALNVAVNVVPTSGVILGVLAVTVIVSLTGTRGRALRAASAARRHATTYLGAEDPRVRVESFLGLQAEQERIRMLPVRRRVEITQQDDLMTLLGRVHAEHAASGEPRLPHPGLRREHAAAR